MVTQNANLGYLIPVIEDAVQLWHFVQISRKYGQAIAKDETLYDERTILTIFKDRADVVKTKHMFAGREQEALNEIIEELDDIKAGAAKPKVLPTVNVITRPDTILPKEKEIELPKKPYALLRSIHSMMIEMDARLKRIETNLSSSDH